MTTTTIPAVLPPGSQARVLRDETRSLSPVRAGTQFIVEDFVPAAEVRDGKGGYYVGSGDGGVNNVVVGEGNVELVRTPKQVDERTIPSAASVVAGVDAALIGMDGDDFACVALRQVDANAFEVEAEAENGLLFAFRVTVGDLRQIER